VGRGSGDVRQMMARVLCVHGSKRNWRGGRAKRKQRYGRTRGEVKLGCVFSNPRWTTSWAGAGARNRKHPYTGAYRNSSGVFRRLYTESQQRGLGRAQKKVVMGDGAEVWTGTQEIFREPPKSWIFSRRQHRWDSRQKLIPAMCGPKRRLGDESSAFLGDGTIEPGESLAPPGRRKVGAGPRHRDGGPRFRAQTRAHALPAVPSAGTVRGSGVIEGGLHRTVTETGSNAPECSGPFAAPMRSSPSVAAGHSSEFDEYWSPAGMYCPSGSPHPGGAGGAVQWQNPTAVQDVRRRDH